MTNSYNKLIKSLENKRLIIFGTGNYFTDFIWQYEELLDKVECALDNKYKQTGLLETDKTAITVIPPQMIVNYDISKYVILFCSKYAKEMKEQLDHYIREGYEFYEYPLFTLDEPNDKKNLMARVVVPALHITREYDLMDAVLNITGCISEKEFREHLISGAVMTIPRLVVVLTSKCTLRCKECDNLMRHFRQPGELNVDVILESLKKIINAVDILPCCELIGGEPFLSNNLAAVLHFLLNQNKVAKIQITTNGTILPQTETLPMLKNKKICVRISDYGNVINQSRFINYMRENEIDLKILPQEQWIANGETENRGRNDGSLIQQYNKCLAGKVCKTLWEDKLFVCARAASLTALGCMGDEQALRVGASTDLREEIVDFLCGSKAKACGYCDIGSGMERMVQPAEQIENK